MAANLNRSSFFMWNICTPASRQRGFSLIEMMLVLFILAVTTGAVALAWQESAQTDLEREAMQLAELLERTHARARMVGEVIPWDEQQYLNDHPRVGLAHEGVLWFGPEPHLESRHLEIWLAGDPRVRRLVTMDGAGVVRVEGEAR